jgi:hypothetical protein
MVNAQKSVERDEMNYLTTQRRKKPYVQNHPGISVPTWSIFTIGWR